MEKVLVRIPGAPALAEDVTAQLDDTIFDRTAVERYVRDAALPDGTIVMIVSKSTETVWVWTVRQAPVLR